MVTSEWETRIRRLRTAAQDTNPISGLTHRFYRYPARFSPTFAATAIQEFSNPGNLVLDPFMGGGTTIVEALTLNRRVAGCDLNPLAAFVAQVKTTPLTAADRESIAEWADEILPLLSYSDVIEGMEHLVDDRRTHNLQLPSARPIKKILALALLSIDELLPGKGARDFARCALLNAGQWALDGRRKSQTSTSAFRGQLQKVVHEMLSSIEEYEALIGNELPRPVLINDSASELIEHAPFSTGELADLVVTSPPYPGIHVLYHRWQVDGRRESPAPYWIVRRQDGAGASFYNFADRRRAGEDTYFHELRENLAGIRRVMRDGAFLVQMVAFGNRDRHLPRYLRAMASAGFEEIRTDDYCGTARHRRIWRSVPNRNWHAAIKGDLQSSREVALIHRAR